MVQPKSIIVINAATLTGSPQLLTSTGAFTDTQTITINGVVFTTNTALGAAGSVVIGASAAITITNLAAAINAPSVTTTTFTALSQANIQTLARAGVKAVATSATVLTITSTNGTALTVSETQTNASFSAVGTSSGIAGIGESGVGRASLQFVATGITSGNGVLTVNVSNDGVTWTAYNRLTTNATNTNAQTDARVASVTLSSNGSSVVTIPDVFAYFQVFVTITTDGSYSVSAYIT